MPEPGETPILILTGPPGVGKTTAAEILAGRADRAEESPEAVAEILSVRLADRSLDSRPL